MNEHLQAEFIRREIERLIEVFPDLNEDDELRADMLEGETDFRQIMSRLVAKSREARAQADVVKAMQDQLGERRKRHQRRDEAFRALMMRLMDSARAKSLTLPEATISVRAGTPSVIVTDEAALPDDFWKIVPSLDKAGLKEALKDGAAIPGAVLSNGEPNLSIRFT